MRRTVRWPARVRSLYVRVTYELDLGTLVHVGLLLKRGALVDRWVVKRVVPSVS